MSRSLFAPRVRTGDPVAERAGRQSGQARGRTHPDLVILIVYQAPPTGV
jgi:hypothetical protein